MSERAVAAVIDWYEANKRDLPWREGRTSPWGVLVAEVMAQQTPVARVAPQWMAWMRRWPTPADLANAAPADVITQWDRLGYPRRALRLRECAIAVSTIHGGVVPADYQSLVALPGIGDYTANALLAFAFGQRALVLDTNVRRVAARVFSGIANHPPHVTATERAAIDAVTPGNDAGQAAAATDSTTAGPRSRAAEFAQALMELGAVVCRPAPQCDDCPLAHLCAWRASGFPAAQQPARRPQVFTGTDRQARGVAMKLLREAGGTAVNVATIHAAWHEHSQMERALQSLVSDGLAEKTAAGEFHLPGRSQQRSRN